MTPIENILVPIDFSRASELALEFAVDIAERFDAHLTLVHVFELPRAPYLYERQAPDEELTRAAQRILDAKLSEVRKRHADVNALHLAGVPAERIIECVAERRPDLVVMGARGHSTLDRLLVGSVTSKVLRASIAPVLTVPEP